MALPSWARGVLAAIRRQLRPSAMGPAAPCPVVLLLAGLCAVLSPALAAPGAAPRASASSGALAEEGIDEAGEMLWLQVVIGGWVLEEALPAWQRDEHVFLPLGALARTLGLDLEVDATGKSAGGQLLGREREFHLDLDRAWVRHHHGEGAFDLALTTTQGNEIFVRDHLLSLWWDIELVVELGHLRVLVRSARALPVESRRRRARSLAGRASAEDQFGPRYPPAQVPFQALSWPAIDGTTSFTWDRAGWGLRQDLWLSGDLLWLSSRLFLSSTRRSTAPGGATSRAGRLTLGRATPNATLLGPLRARSVQLGDLVTSVRPLIAQGRSGRGLEISSFPLHRAAELDRVTLCVQGIPGWDAELSRNDALLAYTPIGEDGQLCLSNLPLLFGRNEFRWTLHGPQGQRQVEQQLIWVDDDMVPAGSSYYRVQIVETGRNLLSGGTASLGEAEQEAVSDLRWGLDYERGLTRGLSLSLALDQLTTSEGRQGYATIGLRFFRGPGSAGRRGLPSKSGLLSKNGLPRKSGQPRKHGHSGQPRLSRVPLSGRLLAVVEDSGGRALGLVLQGRLAGLDYSLRLEDYLRFGGDGAGFRLPLRRVLQWRVEGRLGRRGAGGLTATALRFDLLGDLRQQDSGHLQARLAVRLNGRLPRFAWSQGLSWSSGQADLRTIAVATVEPEASLDASTMLSGRLGSMALRAQLGYRLSPSMAWRELTLQVERALGTRQRLHASLQRSLDLESSSRLALGWTWRRQPVSLGAELSYGNDQRLGMRVAWSYGLRREPASGRWRASPPGGQQQATAMARVFLDRDLDGSYGPDDQAIAGAQLEIDGRRRGGLSDERGLILVSGLPLARHVDLGLATSSLQDPYWQPSQEGTGWISRPGRVPLFDLPVVTTGEIEGTVWGPNARGQQEEAEDGLTNGAQGGLGLAGVEMQLIDAAGDIVQQTLTEVDGYYLFEGVPPGRYQVQVASGPPAGSWQLGAAQRVRIDSSGSVISGLDFRLQPAAQTSIPSCLETESSAPCCILRSCSVGPLGAEPGDAPLHP